MLDQNAKAQGQISKLEVPLLDNLFFSVCQTAIKNCSWKYSEMENIKVVLGQLDALHSFYVEMYAEKKRVAEAALAAKEAADKAAADGSAATMDTNVPATPDQPHAGVSIEPANLPPLEGSEPVAEAPAPETPTQPEQPAAESEDEKKKS